MAVIQVQSYFDEKYFDNSVDYVDNSLVPSGSSINMNMQAEYYDCHCCGNTGHTYQIVVADYNGEFDL
jgi:hypothetical protein